MKNFINDIKNIYLLIKRYYNDKRYKNAYDIAYKNLHLIYGDDYGKGIYLLGITDMWVDFAGTKFIINIVLSKPGVLIGKGGEHINKYIKYTEESLNFPCEVKIIENLKFY